MRTPTPMWRKKRMRKRNKELWKIMAKEKLVMEMLARNMMAWKMMARKMLVKEMLVMEGEEGGKVGKEVGIC